EDGPSGEAVARAGDDQVVVRLLRPSVVRVRGEDLAGRPVALTGATYGRAPPAGTPLELAPDGTVRDRLLAGRWTIAAVGSDGWSPAPVQVDVPGDGRDVEV